ncbi:PAS domain-containing protein [uncultured Brevundimonas sp.]|uniref:PAS domain-containing protein n=1 Tax=uncultured Brevundimonas sp. TaxID=213418 RepID=UPI0030EBA70C|tara:strand:- start:887 stop:2686 length:1800 start_codon:yes stop_codon:yes gene_type:complete
MFMEGEVNWVLLLGGTCAVLAAITLVSLWFALSHRVQHVSTSDQLDMVQKVADAADRRLLETLNAIPVALVETDRAGKFIFANRAAHQLLGRRDAELIGLRFHSATWGITYPDGRPVPPDLLPSARALRGQTVKGFQHLMANPATRRKMLVSVTAMPIEDARGDVTGSIAAIVETESLTQPEPAPVEMIEVPVASSDPLTRRVFEAASSALVVIDADGRIREANRTALGVLDVADDLTGRPFIDVFMDAEERSAARDVLQAALTPGSEVNEQILSGVASDRPIRWSLLPLLDESGMPDAVLLAGERADGNGTADAADAAAEAAATVEIVTAEAADREATLVAEAAAARHEAEQARAEAETARAAALKAETDARAELEGGRRMESVGRLTGGVAHDFNALLGVMTGALDMMLRQADDPGRIRRLGQAALAAGRKGELLTRRLTAFSQGDDSPVLQVLDPGVLLRGLEGKLRDQAGSGIDLMIEGPSEEVQVRLDPVAFDGAVRALLANAIEALDGQGSVAVRLEALMEGGVKLSVRDSGPGMDAELAARAVEPFFTTKDGAAGLGLSQAYAFARQSGGVLSIDSRPGDGAEVAITLPAAT